ncbi:MAG: hypothetical protein KDC56_11760 [Flavobacteriaceae bacterium]|nr:hypothetical protein [Flavobacteriaceae bacterium]
MKRSFLSTLLVIFIGLTAWSQEISPNAIGIRTGSNDGFGMEVSFQHAMGGNNRLEADLGWSNNNNYDYWKLTGLYQWVWNIDQGFNWYAGFGAGIGNANVKRVNTGSDGLFLNADGNLGIEYNFDIPLLISLDFRPEFGIINDYGANDVGMDIALGIRYQF